MILAKEDAHDRHRVTRRGGVDTRCAACGCIRPIMARVVREVESESALGIAVCAAASTPLWALALAWAWVIS